MADLTSKMDQKRTKHTYILLHIHRRVAEWLIVRKCVKQNSIVNVVSNKHNDTKLKNMSYFCVIHLR